MRSQDLPSSRGLFSHIIGWLGKVGSGVDFPGFYREVDQLNNLSFTFLSHEQKSFSRYE